MWCPLLCVCVCVVTQTNFCLCVCVVTLQVGQIGERDSVSEANRYVSEANRYVGEAKGPKILVEDK